MKTKLTRKEVAKMLEVSAQTVDNYRKKGILPAIRYGDRGSWRYQLLDVIRFREGKQ